VDSGYTLTLDELKEYNIRLVNEIYEETINGGFSYDSNIYASSEDARDDIDNAIVNALTRRVQDEQFDPGFVWYTAAGTAVTFTADEIIELGDTLRQFLAAAKSNAQDHIDAINAFSVYQDLADYDITTGWPTNTTMWTPETFVALSSPSVQDSDADLDAIAGLSTTGIIARTGPGTATTRTITQPAAGITVTDGDGVAGNPTLALANDLAALEGFGSTGFAVRIASDSWAQRTITGATGQITLTFGNGVAANPLIQIASNPTLPGNQYVILPGGSTANRPSTPSGAMARYNAELHIFEGYIAGSTNDWLDLTKQGTVTSVDVTGSTGLTPSGGPITTSGSITLTLDTGLQNLATFASTGLVVATGTDTWTARSLASGAGINITNADGVSGNPTISSTITQYTDELAQDAIGTILTDSSSIDFTYDDGAPSITATVIDNTSTQRVEVVKNSGAVVGTRKQLNFVEGSNITLTIADDTGNDQVDITIASSGGGGGAPADATYVTLTTNATLTNERVLTGTINQIDITDNGAGNTVVLSLPSILVAPGSVQATTNFIAGTATDSFTTTTGTNLTIHPGAASNATAVGNTLTVSGGPGGGTSGAGGAVTIQGGIATSGAGGAVTIAGRVGVGTNQDGGNVSITAGNPTGTGTAGAVTISSGALQGAGTPGNINILAGNGNGSTTGGQILIRGGSGGTSGNGAQVTVTGGLGGSTSGNGGSVLIQGGQTFGGAGGVVTVQGNNGVGTNQAGGGVTIKGGSATGSGAAGLTRVVGATGATNETPGAVSIEGGPAQGSSLGGQVVIIGGTAAGVGAGGQVSISGGTGGSTSGVGGEVLIRGGLPVSGAGGPVNITGRDGVGTNQNGGAITLTGGAATGSGSGGNISFIAGPSPSGTDGSIIFTTDGTERFEIRGNGGWEVGGLQGTSGQVLTSNGANTPPTWSTMIFTRGGTVLSPSVANIIVWRAPFACTVTNVRGYRVGGTGATINARRNGTSNHLSSALSVTSTDTWMDGGAVQNTAYVAGDKMEIMIASVSGSPAQVAVQVDLTRP